MLFKMTFVVSLLTACGSTQPKGVIGQKLEELTSLYSAGGVGSMSLFLVDDATKRILSVDVDNMAIKNAYSITKPENNHTLLSGSNGAYVVDFSTKHLEVVRSDGSREEKPFAFQGTPVSAAFNRDKGILAMQDNLQSIGLMFLSSEGKILKSWLGGSLLDKSKSILAGDLDSGGRLILAVSDKLISIVNVETSIDTASWKSESFDSSIENISWVAPDHQTSNLSLVVATDAIAIIDSQNKIVADKLSLSNSKLSVVGTSKLIKPHVLTKDSGSGRYTVYSVGTDGKLSANQLPNFSIDGYTASYLNTAGSEWSLLYSKNDSHRIITLRLSDGLVIFNDTVKSTGDVQLGPDLLFMNRKSSLGYLRSQKLSTGAIKELKGFNFDYLRSR